jgi:hypothetical protein
MAFDPATALLDIGGKLLDRFIPDPVKRDEAKVALLQAQQSGELAKMANETEMFKAALADVASARERESAIATSSAAPMLNKVITPILALVVTGGGGWMLYVSKDADTKMALVGLITLVLGYYFGTSVGSTKTNLMFRDIVRKQSETTKE